jgi:antitoxin ParD1/3/4
MTLPIFASPGMIGGNQPEAPAMPTRNVNLTDHFDRFIEVNVHSGQYQNASEVVREGLRLLELRQREDELRLQRLRDAIAVGEAALEQGDYEDVEDDDLGEYLAGLGESALRRTSSN